jgi:hypothetical protein
MLASTVKFSKYGRDGPDSLRDSCDNPL